MYSNIEEFEQHCFQNAAYFTAIRGRSPFGRIKQKFDTHQAALDFAAIYGDGRTMIYAVTAAGRSGHIGNA